MTGKPPTTTARYLCAIDVSCHGRNAPGRNLALSVRFSADTISFGPFNIRVAASSAYLNFNLENCTMNLSADIENTWPTATEEGTHVRSRTKEQHRRKQIASGKLSTSPLTTAQLGGQLEVTTAKERETDTTRQSLTRWQHIAWRGNAELPSLAFDSRPLNLYLSGTLLKGDIIGSLEPHSRYYGMRVALEIPKSSLLIESGEEFKSYPNKRGILKIIVARKLCREPILIQNMDFFDE